MDKIIGNTEMVKLAAAIILAFTCLGITEAVPVELPPPFDAALGQKYRAELEFVMVPTDGLPQDCMLAREIANAPIYPATTNPHVTEDTNLIEFVAALLGARRLNLTGVSAAVTALYLDREPGREIGVWGLRFGGEAAAAKAYEEIIMTKVCIRLAVGDAPQTVAEAIQPAEYKLWS